MKRIKNRGFILVETLIVAVFVLAIFVFIYQNAVPLMGHYEKNKNFDDLDSTYAVILVRDMLIDYLDWEAIDLTNPDSLLRNVAYLDVSNCNNENIYLDSDFCNKLKETLGIKNDNIIYLTRYNLRQVAGDPSDEKIKEQILLGKGISFRNVVSEETKFESGALSNFRDYLNTVPDNEPFYNPASPTNKKSGVYRVFITRTVETFGKEYIRYANIGIYR